MLGKGKTTRIIVMFIVLFALCLVSSKVKAFSLTLNSLPDENAIRLDWDGTTGGKYKVWQLKPGDSQYKTISTMSMNTTREICRVLNIYPTGTNETVTFTTYENKTYTLIKSANLKQWMEQPNSVDPKGYGRGLINVTPVSIHDFNANPSAYLKDANGNYIYDVIYIGHWDGNAGQGLSTGAVTELEKFINAGLGCLLRT